MDRKRGSPGLSFIVCSQSLSVRCATRGKSRSARAFALLPLPLPSRLVGRRAGTAWTYLESVVDQGIKLFRIRLEQAQIEDPSFSHPHPVPIALPSSFLGLSTLLCLPDLLFLVHSHLHLLEGFLEVVQTGVGCTSSFFHELERSQTETTVLVRLSEETDGLGLETKTTDAF